MTTPPTTSIQTNEQKIQSFRDDIQNMHLKTIQNLLGNKDEALKFVSAIIHSINTVPELLNCDKTTVMSAFMKCVELKLYPSSASGEAFVLPYAGKAQFQLGYQGIIKLLARSGIYIETKIIYEKDYFEYEEGVNPKLIHRPDIFLKDRGAPKGVYAWTKIGNMVMYHVMNADQIMTYKDFSKSKDSAFSPWKKVGADPELWMWRKTCIKQLAKKLPKNEELNHAIEQDNTDSNVAQPYIDRANAGLANFQKLPEPDTENQDS